MFTARIGYLITTGPTGDLARARAEQAARALTVQLTPAAAGPAA
ncbi:hypothetical protein ACWC2T_19845 [Streptomyces sp. NPDC001393]